MNRVAALLSLATLRLGGWRAFISRTARMPAKYNGAERVHSLVTLGLPHAPGTGVPFVHVKWINKQGGVPEGDPQPSPSAARKASRSGFAHHRRLFILHPDGTGGEFLDGDGITTIDSAIALPGAETLVLDDTTHLPWNNGFFAPDRFVAPELTKMHAEGQPWYGSEGAVGQVAAVAARGHVKCDVKYGL